MAIPRFADFTPSFSGGGADTELIEAGEALTAPCLVAIDPSTQTVVYADATMEGLETVGFVLTSVALGADATVYFSGRITGLSSLTIGSRQYMDTTPGGITETPPSTSGNVVQCVGIALTATTIDFRKAEPITLN